MIGLVPQRELRAAYAVGVAAGDRAVMAGQRLVFLQGSETEHDIVGPTRAVGYVDLGDDTAEAEEAHAQAAVVGHREDVDRLSILRGAVRRVIERRGPAEVSSPDHRRQCRGDGKGACRARTAFALEAEAACEVYHGISFLRARSQSAGRASTPKLYGVEAPPQAEADANARGREGSDPAPPWRRWGRPGKSPAAATSATVRFRDQPNVA